MHLKRIYFVVIGWGCLVTTHLVKVTDSVPKVFHIHTDFPSMFFVSYWEGYWHLWLLLWICLFLIEVLLVFTSGILKFLLGAWMYRIMSFWKIDFIIIKWPSLSLVVSFAQKSILCDIRQWTLGNYGAHYICFWLFRVLILCCLRRSPKVLFKLIMVVLKFFFWFVSGILRKIWWKV